MCIRDSRLAQDKVGWFPWSSCPLILPFGCVVILDVWRDHGSRIYRLVPHNQRAVSPYPDHKTTRPLDALNGSSERCFCEGEGASHSKPCLLYTSDAADD